MKKEFEHISLLHDWIITANGWFNLKDLTSDKEYQRIYEVQCEKLVLAGHLSKHATQRWIYKKKESELEEMDFLNATADPVKLWLPFGLDDLVEIFPGNMILIAGMKSTGKTALCLNIVYENQKEWDVHYFNSEMGAKELRKRLDLFPYMTVDQWEFKAWRRAGNFGDAIQGGEGKLIIIDFLEIHDEFYAVGRALKAIHDNLKGAVAIVAIQKNPGSDVGLGGWRSAEVSRLYLAVDRGVVKITDAKNFKQPDKNPNGWRRFFTLRHGCQINCKEGWKMPEKKE
jgi:hypothetical protein